MTGRSLRLCLFLALLAFLAWQSFGQRVSTSAPVATPSVTAPGTTATMAPPPNDPASDGDVAAPPTDHADGLPPEAQATLRLIASHGPFPYDRDGVVFGNFEHRLPEQPRGYYHEYTVPTPGARNRGARRIITGGDPPRNFYYTDDHYRTFRPIGARP